MEKPVKVSNYNANDAGPFAWWGIISAVAEIRLGLSHNNRKEAKKQIESEFM